MQLLSKIEELAPPVKAEILFAYNKVEGCIAKNDSRVVSEEKEKLADLLNGSGLYEEARQYLYRAVETPISMVDRSRILRKISSSYTAQREYVRAWEMAEQALLVLRRADESDINISELFETVSACAFANYFIGKAPRLKELIKEMRLHFSSITDKSVRLRFYFVVMLDILLRHRWYMLPEESITHGEFYLQLAQETQDWNTIGSAYSGIGFVHVWREEFELARLNFEKAFESLQNRNLEYVLTCQTYTTVSYRMQNNVSMTERWAMISIEVAEKIGNQSYLAIAYGNLAWVYAKRSNWLYAEDYARKGIDVSVANRYPMLYLIIFPLLECLYESRRYDEAGMYAYVLLHPYMKAFPPTVNKKLEQLGIAWIGNKADDIRYCLEDVITEAKMANYF